ncbi:bicyclomycin resistance [Trichoderma arundinaceum]|uniref:Bicyclomycin resistance n=1 Tax=Trichoderma arundinaceum TaxID=490622 RepID=A0A395N7G4_TRIAR|nr:bicyclomycin resistance [Trichoderma arundinaceum]
MASSNTSTEAQSQLGENEAALNPATDEKHDLERNSTSISRGTRESDDAADATAHDTEKQIYTVQDVDSSDDENTVWWDGDDDPENPYNWPMWRKVLNCVLISSLTFITPLASCMSTSP